MIFLNSLLLIIVASAVRDAPNESLSSSSTSRLLDGSQQTNSESVAFLLGDDGEMIAVPIESSSGRRVLSSEDAKMTSGRMLQSLPEPTDRDQYMMEIVNRARLDPQGEADRYLDGDLNEGLRPGTISTEPKQPLAWNLHLQKAARDHGLWMLQSDVFSHGGAGGSGIFDRFEAAGFEWSGTIRYGENLAWDGTNGTPDYESYVRVNNQRLFMDTPIPSRGHRLDMMRPSFMEVGISNPLGSFRYGSTIFRNSMMTVQDFAATNRNGRFYITGVAYTDAIVDDDFYTMGEGIGGITVTAVDVNDPTKTFSTTTMQAGGYMLLVPENTMYTLTFSGNLKNDGSNADATFQVFVQDKNVKQDVVSDQISTDPSDPEWSAWSSWSRCSADCGGTKKRTRTCVGGTSCVGSDVQALTCNGVCPPTGVWGQWSDWSCSRTCGFGTQTRTRSCLTSGCAGHAFESGQCNQGDCPTIPSENVKLPISSYTGFDFFDNSWGYLSHCFDGEYGEGKSQKNYVCHSEEMENPWIEITLPQVYTISSIKIWNRWGCCQSRLGLHEWYVDGNLCHSSVADSTFEIEDSCGMQGSTIRLVLPGQFRVINLQEIEIFGSSPDGTVPVVTEVPIESTTVVVDPEPEPKDCAWMPVSLEDCPNFSTSKALADCHDHMAPGDLCEADSVLPDGNSNYNINNCEGGFDVFQYVCSGVEPDDDKQTDGEFLYIGSGLCRSPDNTSVRGKAHLSKTDAECRAECESSSNCVGYSSRVTGTGICYVYGQFGHNLPSGWSESGGFGTEVAIATGLASMNCYKLN